MIKCAHVAPTPAVSWFADSNWVIMHHGLQGGECGSAKVNAWIRLGIIDLQSTSGTWILRRGNFGVQEGDNRSHQEDRIKPTGFMILVRVCATQRARNSTSRG